MMTAETDRQQQQQQSTGPRAAWTYLRLALHALLDPALRSLPPLGMVMRAYLLACMMLYAYLASDFLAIVGRPMPAGGDPVFASHVALLLWGLTALLVCVAQLAALLIPGWRVWQICAVATASWASAFGAVLLYETLRAHGNLLSLVGWGFFIVIHTIFIQHRLVRISAPAEPHGDKDGLLPPSSADDGGHGALELSEEEENDLLKRLHSQLALAPRLVAGSAGAA